MPNPYSYFYVAPIPQLLFLMSDNLQNRGPAARARGNETHEVHYWTQKFNCTAEQFRAAVP